MGHISFEWQLHQVYYYNILSKPVSPVSLVNIVGPLIAIYVRFFMKEVSLISIVYSTKSSTLF
jgi:hypothetical protein